jgi:hypothetical protein
MTNALRDQNRIPVALGVSNTDSTVTLPFKIDSTTGRVLMDATSGTSLTVGTSTITGGTTTRVLFDNAGVVGEYVISGSGNVAMTTSPVFTTPNIGSATGSISGNAATVTTNANLTGVITSVGNATSIASQTGTGTKFVVDTSPTLVTPVLGVATATSINGNTFTTGTYTLTGTASKTLNFTNTLTLSGTDSTTMTFPSTSATIARTDAAQTFTGTQTFSQVVTTNNAITASGNAATVPVTSKVNTVTNNSAATLTITLTTTSAVDGQTCIVRVLDFSAAAQTITWVNTENSTVSAPTTSNGSTTLPLTIGFMYNNATSKWRCVASA